MTHGGLLHSVTPGSLPAYGSPRHFAVSRDLLRLPMPRHSLCALCSLTLLYACFSNFFELLEIAVFYPNFFEYLTLISSLLFFHCSVFKIPCSNATAFERQYHRCRTSSFLPLRGTAMNCFLPSRSVRRDLAAGLHRLVGTNLESLSAFMAYMFHFKRFVFLFDLACLSAAVASRGCLSTSRSVRRGLTAGSTRWWAQVDSNHRPHAYQACALTT